MNFFGTKPVDPVEQTKNWKRELQKTSRKLERDIAGLERAEKDALKECKKLAKAGNQSAARILAKEVVNTRKAIDRMYQGKAQINSVCFALQNSLAMIKIQGCISKSTEVMTAMNQIINLPEMQATMGTFAREMERAGMIDEIVGETFESLEDPGLETEADQAADKIVEEIMAEVLAPAGAVPMGKPKVYFNFLFISFQCDHLSNMNSILIVMLTNIFYGCYDYFQHLRLQPLHPQKLLLYLQHLQ
jgi:charged multivesicular body protein 3